MQKLTRREKEIFNLLLEGFVPKEIAGKLKISYDTVVSHQKKLYRKLDIHSVDELFDKYKNKKDEINSSNGNGKHSKNKRFIKPKYFIAAGAATILLLIIFISIINATKNIETQKEDREQAIIYLENGTYFIRRNFNKVYLYANRWVNVEDIFYGEQYFTNHQIFLRDIYSGNIDDLMGDSNFVRLKISGEIDKECKMMNVSIHYIYQNEWYYEYQGKIYNSIAHSKGRQISIGPGHFSEEFLLLRENFEPLPEGGYFLVSLTNTLYVANHGWIDDTGEKIPDDIPNGTVCATITNLKIEPLDRLAK